MNQQQGDVRIEDVRDKYTETLAELDKLRALAAARGLALVCVLADYSATGLRSGVAIVLPKLDDVSPDHILLDAIREIMVSWHNNSHESSLVMMRALPGARPAAAD